MIEKGIEQLIEDSSLGTEEAKALRASIDLERAREIVALAESRWSEKSAAMEAAAHPDRAGEDK